MNRAFYRSSDHRAACVAYFTDRKSIQVHVSGITNCPTKAWD